jgi:hypothetical protein
MSMCMDHFEGNVDMECNDPNICPQNLEVFSFRVHESVFEIEISWPQDWIIVAENQNKSTQIFKEGSIYVLRSCPFSHPRALLQIMGKLWRNALDFAEISLCLVFTLEAGIWSHNCMLKSSIHVSISSSNAL